MSKQYTRYVLVHNRDNEHGKAGEIVMLSHQDDMETPIEGQDACAVLEAAAIWADMDPEQVVREMTVTDGEFNHLSIVQETITRDELPVPVDELDDALEELGYPRN